MLSELESEDFQQKSVAGVFKDPISDFKKGGAVLGTLIKGKSTRLIKDTVAFLCFH